MKHEFTIIALTTLVAVTALAQDSKVRPVATDRGVAYLASQQGTNGSWGSGASSVYETAFALAAFINNGEFLGSERYGTNVENALKWLVDQEPTNDLDKVSILHALTAVYSLERIPSLKEDIARRRAGVIAGRLAEPSATLFMITVPPEGCRSNRVGNTDAVHRYVSQQAGPEPLRLYLQTLAMYVDGGAQWKSYIDQHLKPIYRSQETDGSFTRPKAQSKVESTAFAVLQWSVFYRIWSEYIDMGFPSKPEHYLRAPNPGSE